MFALILIETARSEEPRFCASDELFVRDEDSLFRLHFLCSHSFPVGRMYVVPRDRTEMSMKDCPLSTTSRNLAVPVSREKRLVNLIRILKSVSLIFVTPKKLLMGHKIYNSKDFSGSYKIWVSL